MAIQIGGPNLRALTVYLRPGTPVASVLRRFDKPPSDPSRLPEDWTDAPRLRFPDAGVPDWVATTSANVATFSVPAADVDALIATRRTRSLILIGEVPWGEGVWVVPT